MLIVTDFNRIWTAIIEVERQHADHHTITSIINVTCLGQLEQIRSSM